MTVDFEARIATLHRLLLGGFCVILISLPSAADASRSRVDCEIIVGSPNRQPPDPNLVDECVQQSAEQEQKEIAAMPKEATRNAGQTSGVPAKDNRSPIDAYEGDAQFLLMMCSLQFQYSQLNPGETSPKADWTTCVKEGVQGLKVRFDNLMKVLRKPAARAALKEHYISVINAAMAITPHDGEIKMNYSRRQSEQQTIVQDKWTRFSLER